jgi:hypothetical protein
MYCTKVNVQELQFSTITNINYIYFTLDNVYLSFQMSMDLYFLTNIPQNIVNYRFRK